MIFHDVYHSSDKLLDCLFKMLLKFNWSDKNNVSDTKKEIPSNLNLIQKNPDKAQSLSGLILVNLLEV